MRSTGGNRFIRGDASAAEFIEAVDAGILDLVTYAGRTDRRLDVGAVSVETRRVGERISVSVTGDLVTRSTPTQPTTAQPARDEKEDDMSESDELVWECGPHTNAWGGHDAMASEPAPRRHRPTCDQRPDVRGDGLLSRRRAPLPARTGRPRRPRRWPAVSAPEQGGLSEAERAEDAVWEMADELCTTWHENDGEVEGGHLIRRWACQECYDAACTFVDTQWLAARLAAVPAAEAELRAAVEGLADLSAAATPGPWEVWDNVHGDPHIVEHGRGPLTGGIALANTRNDYGRSNAAFIVAAVNLVRSLLAGRGDV